MFDVVPNDLLFASAQASVNFALSSLEPVNGRLRARSSFLTPNGEIAHWHEFGDLEGPGWAANAIGGAHILFQWGEFIKSDDIRRQSLMLLDHILEDGFIDEREGFIYPYFDLGAERFCLNYLHQSDWLCPGSLAKIGVQLLDFAEDIKNDPRSSKMELAALRLGEWLATYVPSLQNGWVPRRINPKGEPFPYTPDGRPDPIYDHSGDGLFVLQLYSLLVQRGHESFRPLALRLGQAFVESGGFFGSINHDTYDDQECVAYASAFLVLHRASEVLNVPGWKQFGYEVALPGLEQFQMEEDRHGVPTQGLLWMEKSWNTAYLWENAEAAQAFSLAWTDRHDEESLEKGRAILSAIALHHHGNMGFLTEGVDWDNHVTRRHHIDGQLYGDIRYTEPLLNNLYFVKPTLFYFQKTGYTPPAMTSQDAIHLVTEIGQRVRLKGESQGGVRYFIRLYYPALVDERRLSQALDFVRRSQADGVLLFEASYDMDPSLLAEEELRRRFVYLKTIVPKFREHVAEVHLNMMITLGHVDAGSGHPECFSFQFMVDETGRISRSTACPLDPQFQERIARQYRLAAETRVDTIWVDDDTRYLFHDLEGMACFCPHHLRVMEERTGTPWDVQSLRNALMNDPSLRAIFLRMQEDSILQLARIIRQAVDEVDPGIRIGLMTVGQSVHAAEGRHTDRLLRILAGTARPLIRPGAGFWNDRIPSEVLDKVEGCARTLYFIGEDCQAVAEIENHPYTPFGKSMQILAMELGLNVLIGVSDLSLNILSSMGGTSSLEPEGRDYANFLLHWRPFLGSLAKARANKKRSGIQVIDHEDFAYHCRSNTSLVKSWLQPRPWEVMLPHLGFPIGNPGSVEAGCEGPVWIAGQVINALSDYDLTWYLRAGAVFDPIAAEGLLHRGWGNRLGLRAVLPVKDGVNEVFSNDPINAPYEGNILPAHHLLPPKQLFTWEMDAGRGRILSRWQNVDGMDCGPGIVLLEVEERVFSQVFNWRVALIPYALDSAQLSMLNIPRRKQWARLLAWVGNKPLPVEVLQGFNVIPMIFKSDLDNETLVAMINLSADEQTCRFRIAGIEAAEYQVFSLSRNGLWEEFSLTSHGEYSLVIPGFDMTVLKFTRKHPERYSHHGG